MNRASNSAILKAMKMLPKKIKKNDLIDWFLDTFDTNYSDYTVNDLKQLAAKAGIKVIK